MLIFRGNCNIFALKEAIITMKRLALFASGEGTNAEAIARYFSTNPDVEVALMICNRKAAGVFQRLEPFNIESHYFPKAEWAENEAKNVIELLRGKQIDLIVLAGFLAFIPASLIHECQGRIINIHPSLLPKYGGSGMWGMNVHQAVIDAHETESGITIHHVSEQLDSGNIIYQATCEVRPDDTPQSLAERVHGLEYQHYPLVIENMLKNL